jgi:hypothetical protein
MAATSVLFVIFVVVPAVNAMVRRQWGWVVGVVLFAPMGGLLWFLFSRRSTPTPARDHGFAASR